MIGIIKRIIAWFIRLFTKKKPDQVKNRPSKRPSKLLRKWVRRNVNNKKSLRGAHIGALVQDYKLSTSLNAQRFQLDKEARELGLRPLGVKRGKHK